MKCQDLFSLKYTKKLKLLSAAVVIGTFRVNMFHGVPTCSFKHILSTAVAYLCVIAVQHILNDPHAEINTGNFPVPVPFNNVVCRVIVV